MIIDEADFPAWMVTVSGYAIMVKSGGGVTGNVDGGVIGGNVGVTVGGDGTGNVDGGVIGGNVGVTVGVGGAVTMTVIVAECDSEPLFPVTVMV